MSLFGKIFKGAGKLIKKVAPIAAPFIPGIGGTIAGALGGMSRSTMPQQMQMGGLMLPALGGIGRAILPAAGAVVRAGAGAMGRAGGARALSRRAIKAAGWIISGGLVLDMAGNIMGKAPAPRRMNPLNHRALRRACRRVSSAKNICSKVDELTGKTPKRRKKSCL